MTLAAEWRQRIELHGKWRRGEDGGVRLVEHGAFLSGADLSGADLSGANLSGAFLRRADLSGANLSGAFLRRADLSGADLSGAFLSGADLSGANLSGAFLRRADLSGANLNRAFLRRANLSGADLSGAFLSGADLSGANLNRAFLRRAFLSGADLSGADLSGADLSGADLSGAFLSGADLSGANLSRARGIGEAIGIATAAEESVLLQRIAGVVLAQQARLNMGNWHETDEWRNRTVEQECETTCTTTHCLAGWAQVLCGDDAKRYLPAEIAGSMLLPRSAHLFFADEDVVLDHLRAAVGGAV